MGCVCACAHVMHADSCLDTDKPMNKLNLSGTPPSVKGTTLQFLCGSNLLGCLHQGLSLGSVHPVHPSAWPTQTQNMQPCPRTSLLQSLML